MKKLSLLALVGLLSAGAHAADCPNLTGRYTFEASDNHGGSLIPAELEISQTRCEGLFMRVTLTVAGTTASAGVEARFDGRFRKQENEKATAAFSATKTAVTETEILVSPEGTFRSRKTVITKSRGGDLAIEESSFDAEGNLTDTKVTYARRK